MTIARPIAVAAASVLLAVTTVSLGADTREMPMRGMGAQQQQHGMMGMGSGGMMGCPMMMSGGMGAGMGGGMMGARGLPVLPPGNEKLQLQMQAEIMQKVGEIVAKYAGQIQTR